MSFEFLNISIGICFKIFVILLLLILHFIYSFKFEYSNNEYLEAGFSKKIFKQYFNILSVALASASIYGLYYTIRESSNVEIKNKNIQILNQQIAELKEANIELRTEKSALEVDNSNANTLMSLIHKESLNQSTVLDKLEKQLINSEVDKSDIKVSVALVQSSIKDSLSKFKELKSDVKYGKIISDELANHSNLEGLLNDSDIKESFILSGFLNKLENLDIIGRLAVSLLLLNSALFSAAVSLIFIFYGDYLLNRFNIELRFPKLAKIIKLRKQFQKYYLISNFGVIFVVTIVEIIFSIAVLGIKL